MRVLFVTHDGVSHEPLGLMYLSASLINAGHKTRACMESNALDAVKRFRPHYVAFQVLSGDEKRWGNVASNIKAYFPKVKTIFGGPHFLYSSKAKQPEADYVVRGDGEFAILNIVDQRPYPDLSSIQNLDDLPHPDRSLLYNDRFPSIKNNVIRNVISCRGCPYKCTYCYNSSKEWQEMTRGGRLRYHSPEWIVDDIERTITDFGGELVSFQDDIFGIDMKWLEKFSDLYQRIRIPFFAQLRPALITEDRVKLLSRAGVHIISFAIESGNEKTRSEILDRKESNDLIRKGCDLLHRYGIKFRMQNLLGLPVDDPLGDAIETLKFNMEQKPTLSWCSLLQAYPGTEIANYVVKKGLVKSIEDLEPLVNATFFDEGSLPIKDIKKIERLHKYWSAVVRWPWLYFIVVNVMIHFDLGKGFQNWIFNFTKTYINAREYWRVNWLDKHVSVTSRQRLDRLGGELSRKEEAVCV